MKKYLWLPVTLTLLTAAALYGFESAQQAPTGWLEGTVLEPDGKPASEFQVRLLDAKHQEIDKAGIDRKFGGLYSFTKIPAGVYELRVERTPFENSHRPVRAWGIVVKPNARTVFDVQLLRGNELVEIGKPAVVTQPAIIVADEIQKLKKDVAELKNKRL